MDTIEKAVKKIGGESPAPATLDDGVSLEPPPSGPDAAADVEASADEAPDQRTIEIDLESLQAGGIVDPHSTQRDQVAEEFRRIKRPLLKHVRGESASSAAITHPNLVMVTSSLAGEGKTFTSINLALSIAMEKDMTVLLVDADVAKPEVTKRLGIQAEKGLTDVLLDDDLGLGDVLIRTSIPKLSILPAGRPHPHATELLASSAMKELADEMSMRYPDRVIIFDSPPLLLTSEARVLAGLMGQILVVVEESKTPQPVLQEALNTIDGTEVVGLVLNKAHHHVGADLYGAYGYGYGYGYKR